MNLLNLVGEPVMEFKDSGVSYVRDMRAKNTLNKVMGTDFKAVYREKSCYDSQWSSKTISCDGERFYVLRKDNKVFWMYNSEWCGIGLEDNKGEKL